MTRFHIVFLLLSVIFASCAEKIDNTGTCIDGIKNQGEQAVDCGGPCGNPCPSCADGIRNQDETAVDCGGSCDPCYARLSAIVNNVPWSSTSRNAFISGPGTLRIYGTNQNENITLYYSGPFTAGTVAAGPKFTGELRDELGNLYASAQGGYITFSTFDTTSRTVSGEFTFMATDTTNGVTKSITSGVFNVLPY